MNSMDGIEKITARISQDTEEEIAALKAEAAEKAETLTRQYAQQAETVSDEIKTRGKRAAAERQERLLSAAQLEAKKNVLAMKQSVLDEAFEKALQSLQGLPEPEYVALLTKLILQGSRTGKEQLIFSPADRTRFGKKVVSAANAQLKKENRTAELTLSETSKAMKGGVILNDGKIEMNCTFETILRLLRKDTAGQVAKLLFD